MSDKPTPEPPTPDPDAAESRDSATPATTDPSGTATGSPIAAAVASEPATGDTATESGTAEPGARSANAVATTIESDFGGAGASEPGVGGGASGARSTAVLTETAPETTSSATQGSADSAPFAALLTASRAAADSGPGDSRPAAWSVPPPIPRVPPNWQRVARPPGVLPAAAIAGIVGATVIPLDRPGIGWLIAGAAVTATLCVVDHRARSRSTSARSAPASGSAGDLDKGSTTASTTVDAAEPAQPKATPADTGSTAKTPVGAGLRADATAGKTPPNKAVFPAVSFGDRAWWAAAAIVLLGVGTVRAAEWLFALCVIAACVAGSLAVSGRRTVRGTAHDLFAVPLAAFGAVPWAFSGLRESRSVGTASVSRYGISVAATAVLLVVFVPLLGGADATFARLLNGLVPTVDGPAAWRWTFLFVVVAVGVLGALYLLAGPPAGAADSARPQRLWARGEWMLPVGALTVLFAVFLGAQFVALFGGDDYVQRTAGLTYAEYARSGFWQLSAVSILTLAVILAVLHWSAQDTAADRRWLRVLLSVVSVLALVIVCSALGRMWTYQQAYGFTVLRLLVTTCELWVGLVYLLVLLAIARLRWSWVPRAAIGTALGTLIALALINPEHLVAERNIDRWHTSGRLDATYLNDLSTDILPALDPLPAHLRTQIETPILDDLDDDHWWSWNFSRSSAR
ncbi:DUF4173 domain-containing protein [Nocardia alba]|uniref:Uncharacterized protein DUF4173 n=1 Tax=Nocardia alba TaxID=225051 RepID=A0A4R1FPH9_9NOCA|nr:DUF4173 domain-containing protein [Nocardia alba]TCJ95319.1 uncharacterized protein DUF4173 [Nocardia alba]